MPLSDIISMEIECIMDNERSRVILHREGEGESSAKCSRVQN